TLVLPLKDLEDLRCIDEKVKRELNLSDTSTVKKTVKLFVIYEKTDGIRANLFLTNSLEQWWDLHLVTIINGNSSLVYGKENENASWYGPTSKDDGEMPGPKLDQFLQLIIDPLDEFDETEICSRWPAYDKFKGKLDKFQLTPLLSNSLFLSV